MIVHNVQQGTKAWLALRAGKPTASMFSHIMTAGKRKSESRHKYMNHLLGERMLGAPVDGFQSQYMAQGNQFEDRAVASWQVDNGYPDVERIGFVTTDDGFIGCSPDRFIGGTNGLLQAKAPGRIDIHVSYLRASAGAADEYKVQVQGELWVCEKDYNVVVSYYPGLPNAVFRMERDDDFIAELEAHVRAFSCQLEEKTAEFVERGWIRKVEAAPVESPWLTDDDVKWALSQV